MKYDLIFYKARKTSLCQKAIAKRFAERSSTLNNVILSHSPAGFGKVLINALKKSYLVIAVAELGGSNPDSLENVLSNVLANSGDNAVSLKLKGRVSADGYVIKCGTQNIVVLPDEPNEYDNMLSPELLDLVCV